MSAIQGTPYFKNKVKGSINALTNGEALFDWKPDMTLNMEFNEEMTKARYQLEDGILLKFRVLRQRQLERQAAQTCYSDPKLNFIEAEQCEKFLVENDYKLSAINQFFYKNTIRHVKAYNKCLELTENDDLSSMAEKDKVYLQCHNDWVRNFKQEVVPDLETRAVQLLGNNLVDQE